MQMVLGVDGNIGHRHLALASCEPDRAFEACRPAGRKKLFRIGADTRRAGRRNLDIEPAVGAARNAIFAAADGVGFRRVDHLAELLGGVRLEMSHGSLLWFVAGCTLSFLSYWL